jgi:hypothetical protein
MMGSEMRTLIGMDPHYIELLATDPGVQITILILKKVTEKKFKTFSFYIVPFFLLKRTLACK